MAYSSNSSTGSVGTSSIGSSIGTTSSTSTGTSGVSVGTSASTGMSSTGGSTGTPNNTGFTGLSYSDGTWSPNSNSLGTLSLGTPGLSGFASNNFGTGWSDNGSSSEPAMTVDEVYGKSDTSFGNQSIVESQGDYNATSNEKSNVETSTFGKQDDITVTPESVTENKGIVDNSTIESIEGLNFQQKDKESQDVLEARKSRDDVEAEDKSNQMRDSLKAKTEQTTEEDTVNQLQIGEKNDFEEQNKTRLEDLKQQKQELNDINEYVDYTLESLDKAKENQAKTKEALEFFKEQRTKKEAEVDALINQLDARTKINPIAKLGEMLNPAADEVLEAAKTAATKFANIYNRDEAKEAIANAKNEKQLLAITKDLQNQIKNKNDEALTQLQEKYDKQVEDIQALEAEYNNAVTKQTKVQAKYNEAQKTYKTWEAEYWANDTKTKDEEVANVKTKTEEVTNTKSNAEVSFEATKEAINNAELSEETKSKAIETVNSVEAATKAVNEAADALAANPNDPATIETYVKATKTYIENVKSALKGNPLAKTDLNKTFTEMVAKANDFDVTMPDGTKASYAEFAAEMATKSPALAKGLYEAKAREYEENNHPILARIERAKASMVETWIGSKLTIADNQIRNQFIQMAKTDMRATYATYNNVLNDPNATPEQKAEASAAINQTNALMTASAALQASTGFLSGIGDSMSDGVYGTTDPTTLNAYQKTLNAIDNYTKITLGLGVTPSANEAYQNMYYMAGAKVNESGLFGRDFDSDGFALCQEYGNSAAVGMIVGAGELATGVALFFNPATVGMGLNLVVDSVKTFTDGLFGVQTDARKSQQYTQEVLSYFKEAESIAAETGNKEIINSMSTTMSNAVKQIENFELKSDEVGNLDNWLEGSGSNTATNEKFNQSLTYDEWLKLIEADPTMRDYAKKLIAEKKEK